MLLKHVIGVLYTIILVCDNHVIHVFFQIIQHLPTPV